MQRQGSFLQAEYARKKKPTRRDKFLAEMEAVVPWGAAGAASAAALPKGRARPAADRAGVHRCDTIQHRLHLVSLCTNVFVI
jgi:IS5 family transposase